MVNILVQATVCSMSNFGGLNWFTNTHKIIQKTELHMLSEKAKTLYFQGTSRMTFKSLVTPGCNILPINVFR